MPEVTGANTGCENEVIVRHRYAFAVRIVHENTTLGLIDTGDFAHDHGRVLLLPQNSADRRTDLRRRKHRRRHLIEEWLKHVMVCPINENDFDRRFPKGFGRSQTTKTAADDHHSRRVRRPLMRIIDRIEIRIVHPLFSQAFEPRNFREFWAFLAGSSAMAESL